MDHEEIDVGIVDEAIGGDEDALKLILTLLRGRVRAYIACRLPADLYRVCDPDDIVQEACVEVFRRISAFERRGTRAFERWVLTIALNRLRDAIRRHRAAKRRRPSVETPKVSIDDSTVAFLDTLVGSGSTPSSGAARSEAVRAVHDAIADLPEDHQRAIWIVHIEGRSVRDAAEQMGRTERAVHGLCRRGLERLHLHLGSASRFLSSRG